MRRAMRGHLDRRDVLQHRLQHGRVVGVGSANDHRQRQPAAVTSYMELGPLLEHACLGPLTEPPPAGGGRPAT
jgi:hypothetical protein